MAAPLGSDGMLTFVDLIKMLDHAGNMLPIAETLAQVNDPLQDGPISPSNGDFGHRIAVRSSLPKVGRGKVGKGVVRSKSTVAQRQESMAMFRSEERRVGKEC